MYAIRSYYGLLPPLIMNPAEGAMVVERLVPVIRDFLAQAGVTASAAAH